MTQRRSGMWTFGTTPKKGSSKKNPLDEAYRQAAIQKYQEDGTLEIDHDAKVSIGDDGAYVQAWVYVDSYDLE